MSTVKFVMSFDNFLLPAFDTKSDPNNLSEKWKKWLRSFQYLTKGRAITGDEQKAALLLHLAGSDVQDLYETLNAVGDETTKSETDIVIDRLNHHFTPITDKTFERHLFRKIVQGNDTCDQFLIRLRQSSAKCKFLDEEDQIRGQLIDGCRDKRLRRRILEKGEITLPETIKIARTFELAALQEKLYESSLNDVEDTQQVQKVSTYKPNESKTTHYAANNSFRCYRCNNSGHKSNDTNCPAKDKKCRKCDLVGHFAIVCKTKRNAKDRHVKQLVTEDSDPEYLFNINESMDRKAGVTVTCEVGGIPADFLIDSGSTVNIVNKRTWEHLKARKIKCKTWRSAGTVKAYGGHPVNILGKFATTVTRKNKTCQTDFVVFDGDAPSILSCNTSVELGLISFNVNTVSVDEHKPISGFKASIPVPPNCTLPFHKARPVPYGLLDAVKHRLDEMEDRQIIRKIESASNATPIVVVQKKGTEGKPGGVRICGDYKVSVNKYVKQVPVQNLNVNDLLTKIGDGKIFSRLDLEGAYLQLELDECSKDLTTIHTPFGLYRYERLPYGISASPGIFERCMRELLEGLPGVVAYMDDILVIGESEAEHDANLEKLLTKLQSHNVRINHAKSEFRKTEIEFLGHIISGNGLSPNKIAMETIRSAEYPNDKKELQSWLGSIQFYARYFPKLADKTAPLYGMLKKDTPFRMEEAEKKVIDALKSCLSSPLLLRPYQPDQPVVLTCDASQKGIAGILEQNDHPVLAISKILTEAEHNYSQIEREALAIVWSVKKLSKYLMNRKFKLVTDHKPLTYIFNKEKSVNTITAARIQRWAITLMAYDFDVVCARSQDMHLADLLSRCGTTKDKEFEVNMMWETPLPHIQKKMKEIMNQDKWLTLKKYIRDGFPKQLDARLKDFKNVAQDLTIHGDLVYKGGSLVIPEELQHLILTEIHGDHVGIERSKSFARRHFYWPGMSKDIESLINQCPSCSRLKPKSSSSKQWSSWPAAKKPFERIHIDFGETLGKPFLVVVDSFSRWPEIFVTRDMTETTVINCLRNVIARFGVPQTLVSDNGPSLIAKGVDEWLANIGCEHLTSAEYHPKSNGLAERMVRSFKEYVRVNRTPNNHLSRAADRFLMSYRNIPHTVTGIAPTHLMFGRSVRTPLTIVQNTGFYKLPLQKEYEFGEVVSRRGKMLELENSNGTIVRRHEDQVKLKMEGTSPEREETREEEEQGEEDEAEDRNESATPSDKPNYDDPSAATGIAMTRPTRKPKPIKRFILET